MSVTIPAHFPDWLTRWVIGHFPVGNPDSIRAAADAWARSAERLKVTLQHLERLARDVPAAIEGEAADAIQRQLKAQIANTRNQIEFADGMATLLYDAANSIELEQYIVIGIGAVLLANLLIDAAVPMKAASDRIAADVAATAARRDTLSFMFQRIAAFAGRYPHMTLAIRATIMGAVSMGGVVAGAQYAQIVQGRGKPGRRTSMDRGQVWVAAVAGGGGGLAGSLATRAVLRAFTRTGANAATQVGRRTGRAVAVVLASATGGAAGGAAGAVIMSALTHTKLKLAQMMLMGATSGAVSGFGAAVRATRGMSAARPPEATVPEIGGTRGSHNDGPPVRSTPDSARPHGSADTPRPPHEETIPETVGSQDNGRHDGPPVRSTSDSAMPHGSADPPRPPHEETIPEIGGSRDDGSRDGLPVRETTDGSATRHHKETIDEIGKLYEEQFRKLDEGGTSPHSDTDPPPPGTKQPPPASPTSPGSKSESGHGLPSWDWNRGLELLVEGGYGTAPTESVATPRSSSSTGGPGTAQFHSGRPESPQMGLAGTVLTAEGQPNATPGSVLTMSANSHVETNTHVASAKDLGGTGGGNGPGVMAGSPVAHGDSPTGGGAGPGSSKSGHGPGELPPDSDEAILLDLDFFDYELVPNEPVTPGGNSPTATPHVAGTTSVEPGPGSGSGSPPSPTPTEAKSSTAHAGATPGPGGAPTTPAPPPGANTPHASPQSGQANAPQPQTTPQAGQGNTPQPQTTPHAAQSNTPQPQTTPHAAQSNTPQPQTTP
ncbi:hypothetical protein [Nocardia sp. NPDC049707]|uniref:WXG100-like domain-containing protein n=1 Tax=Nocardia sp. NPDC049707 TaxID=3154735 RepID=UPI003425E080